MLRQTPGSLQTRVVGGRGLTSKLGTRKRCTRLEQQQDVVVVVGEVVVVEEGGGGEAAGEEGHPQRSMRKADARVTIGAKAGRGRVFYIYEKDIKRRNHCKATERKRETMRRKQSKGTCFISITAWCKDELNGEPQFHVPFLSRTTCLMCAE